MTTMDSKHWVRQLTTSKPKATIDAVTEMIYWDVTLTIPKDNAIRRYIVAICWIE